MRLSFAILAVAGAAGVTGCRDRKPAAAPVATNQLASIQVTPATIRLDKAGMTQTLAAAGFDGDDKPLPLTAVTWASSDPQLVAIDGSGKITALRSGSATVTAIQADVRASATVTVEIPGAIRVEPASVAIAKAEDKPRFAATVLSNSGTAIAGPPITFSSADPAIATIDETGVVTGKKNGTTIVTATSGELAAEVRVDVSAFVEALPAQEQARPQPLARKVSRKVAKRSHH